MNRKMRVLGTVGLSVGLVAACHDDHHSAPAPVQPSSQSLDSAQVLLLARKSSESSEPIAVNGGALTLNDTSETSTPIPVAAM